MKTPNNANGKQNFPEPYVTEWMDIGSMTIDNGHRFHFSVDEDGFHVRREYGLWSVSDLFGEMCYWPSLVVWSEANERLKPLLESASRASGMDYQELLSDVKDLFEQHDSLDLDLYLNQEEAAGDDGEALAQLRSKHSQCFDEYQIPGISSDQFVEGSCYAGLTISFDLGGWKATLLQPDDEELFQDEYFEAETFDGLFTAKSFYESSLQDCLRYDRVELASWLVESDIRWEPFVRLEPSTQMDSGPTIQPLTDEPMPTPQQDSQPWSVLGHILSLGRIPFDDSPTEQKKD